MNVSRRAIRAALLGLSAALVSPLSAQVEPGWNGNMAKNPGFEEDFVNTRAEGHVLSFKGDWFYNQQDLIPDYWAFPKGQSWSSDRPHSGSKALKLDAGQTAVQTLPGAQFQDGGSAWAGASNFPIKGIDAAKFNLPLKVTAWVRGEGLITISAGKGNGVTAKGGGADWQLVTAELPADQINPAAQVTVTLTGPGEFDDVSITEKQSGAANLIPNPGFEEADAQGNPTGWSAQKKYRAIGPTYYVWTDWNHAFRDNRGAVSVDPLVAFSGKQSLRFDVYPGDEKYIESDAIVLNQTTPGVIEVGVYVKADRAKLIDVRLVDQDGASLKSVYPTQPEYSTGGTATYGNGTFDWRYVRKFFAAPFDQPMKSVRVRLAARGFNAHTLDDAGTRAYACQVGTVWFDNLHVSERGSTPAADVKFYPAAAVTPPSLSADVDLGDRLYGLNTLRVRLRTPGTYKVKLTTTLPGQQPTVTESVPVTIAANATGVIETPYEISHLAGDLSAQGSLKVELQRDGQTIAASTYAFNTWPVVVDFDVARHYNLPGENPVTTTMNLGVASDTLARTAKIELALVRAGDNQSVIESLPPITDLKAAFAASLDGLPKAQTESYEFNLPTNAWWADRARLLVTKLDLSRLSVHPHDNPMRDTALRLRGLDAAGKVLFEDVSDPFGRMQAPPTQPAITKVEIREDGAILINGQPRYIFGATHQNTRTTHTPAIIAQLGLTGHRLTQGMKNEEMADMFNKWGLYSLQAKPDPSIGGTAVVSELNAAQKTAFDAWVAGGGMKYVVSLNTGGWEAVIDYNNAALVEKHKAFNEQIRAQSQRPTAISTSGAYNAWWLSHLPFYDIDHAETEMWGPMDFNVIFTPYMKRYRKEPTAWVYLPQLYDNTPFERYRFESYENIIRGSAGVSMIQGIGDPTFNRGLAGELRHLEKPLNSLDKAPEVTFEPNVSHKVTSYEGKTYILATNAGPVQIGSFKWNTETKKSGNASHEGDTHNQLWFRPAGIRIHGFRGLPLPELVRKGDKIVQWVWIDPNETPDWAMVAVRGDGRFSHAGVIGKFDFAKFQADYGNVVMFSELEHSVWHDINWVFDPPTYQLAIKLMGQKWADDMKKSADGYKAKVDATTYKAGDFKVVSPDIAAAKGNWVKIELDADQSGLTGKLVDGFAYLTQNGRALWDYSVLERDGKVVRVFCEDSVGIDRALLAKVRINIPGLKKGTKIRPLFENRELTAEDGFFTDDFTGVDTYGYEAGGVEGDMLGFVKDPNRELPRMMPSGYGYSYGPTAVRIYEIKP
ncbi:MAG: hypothetical protein IT444_00120 [Phycisphaeraceae bacterium]|nr:hypothetical protein [Phycisphaeraceae bacterium]